MNGTYDTRIAVRAKVVFLGLFVLALLVAKLVVALRTAVVLGAPIELAHSGFSVSMPEGNGWNKPRGWDYSDGKATLIGTFAPGSWKATALARCSFIFPDEVTDLETRFERRRLAVEGEIVERGRIDAKSLVVEWVRIDQSEGYNYIFGTAELPDYRRIEIEVQDSTGEVELPKRIFEAIALGLRVTENPPLESGAEIIAEIKSRGLAETLENYNSQSLFLIRNWQKRIVGFATDVTIDRNTDEFNIEAMGLYYTESPFDREEMTSFQSNNRFDSFVWKTELVAAGRSGTEIVLDDSGILTVEWFGSLMESEPAPKRSYNVGRAAIPEMLLGQLYVAIMESDIKEALVDVIMSNGRIVPTHISRISPDDSVAEPGYPDIKVKPVSGRGFFQLIYLDNRKRIARVEQQSFERIKERYYFDRSTPEEAAEHFPDHKQFILQNENLKKYLDEMI